MDDKFKVEIISPEKIIFSDEVAMVTIPSYEGDMSILKQHISIITFLRPGIIKVKKTLDQNEDFFVEDGIIEFYKDNLSILSTSAINLKKLPESYLKNISKNALEKLKTGNLTDEENYLLNCKLDVIKGVSA